MVFDVACVVVGFVLSEELKVCVDVGCGVVCCICYPSADKVCRTVPRSEFSVDGVVCPDTVVFGIDEARVHANDG